MSFAAIPSGADVFLDANTLVYHFSAHPIFGPACASLLDRIELKDLRGFTSSHLLGEMVHKLMILEAQQRFGWGPTGLANRLKRHPNEVQQLSVYRQAIDEVHAIGIEVFSVDRTQVSLAADVSKQVGLLTNDALGVVIMRQYGLTLLASNDADFDRVPGLTRFSSQ